MFNQLKQNGIAVKMVQNIATSFFDISGIVSGELIERSGSSPSVNSGPSNTNSLVSSHGT